MENYMVKKLLKNQDLHRSTLNPSLFHKKAVFNTPSPKSSVKDEFLKAYLAQCGGTKLDRNLTLSVVNKNQESRRRHQFMIDESLDERGGFVWTDKSPRNQLPTISKCGSPSNRASLNLRVMTEPNGEDEMEIARNGINQYFIKKYCVRTSRFSQRDSTCSAEGAEVLQTEPDAPQGEKNPNNLLNGFKGSQGEKYSVLKKLEDIYVEDYKNSHEKSERIGSLKISPYGKNAEKNIKLKLKEGSGNGKSIAKDVVLMDRFENPYANLPFEKIINASVRNQSDLKLQELEVKTKVLKNIKEVEDGMVKSSLEALVSPKLLKALSDSPNSNREIEKAVEGGKDKRMNLLMYRTSKKK